MNTAITDILCGLEALETEQDFANKFEDTLFEPWLQQIHLC
jgi:hypothetical protein